MKPILESNNIRTVCIGCDGHKSTYSPMGEICSRPINTMSNDPYKIEKYLSYKCLGCGRGGFAAIQYSGDSLFNKPKIVEFHPVNIECLEIPNKKEAPYRVPIEIEFEYREAELCLAHGAYRAASAMFRSTLEKLLKVNGYKEKDLYTSIQKAAEENVLTEARRIKAQNDVRALGNDVLHDDWKKITWEDVEVAHKYLQRLMEDLYDDRESVEKILISKGRLTPAKT